MVGVPVGVRCAAKAVEDHHRALDAGFAQLVQRRSRRLERLALVDLAQNLIVAALGAEIGHAQTGLAQFDQFVDRLAAEIARQAVAGHPFDRRHVRGDGLENAHQPMGGQHQRIAVGQEHAPNAVTERLARAPDHLQDFRFAACPKLFLRRGVHLAERALVPRTAVGHRQDQRIRFAGRAKHRLDVPDRIGAGMHHGSDSLTVTNATAILPVALVVTKMQAPRPRHRP